MGGLLVCVKFKDQGKLKFFFISPDFYSKNPNFHEIDGTLKIEEITAKIDDFLNV